MDKQQIALRIQSSLNNYIRAVSEKNGTNFTTTCEIMFQVALENRKDLDLKLEKKRLLSLDSMKFEEADAFIHVEMKKAYLVENFRKLSYRLGATRDINSKNKKAVIDALLSRVEIIFGEKSDEYRECQRILKPGKHGEGNENASNQKS